MLYIINAFSGNVNVLSINILFSHRIIIETEVIRAMAGLGVSNITPSLLYVWLLTTATQL